MGLIENREEFEANRHPIFGIFIDFVGGWDTFRQGANIAREEGLGVAYPNTLGEVVFFRTNAHLVRDYFQKVIDDIGKCDYIGVCDCPVCWMISSDEDFGRDTKAADVGLAYYGLVGTALSHVAYNLYVKIGHEVVREYLQLEEEDYYEEIDYSGY